MKDNNVSQRVLEHWNESFEYFKPNNVIGIFLQGSQNYGLATEDSDVDTKLIVTPSLQELICNKKPTSSTHVRSNNEHIDFKDIRLMFDTFKKQNLNFIEILFTPYSIINPFYKEEWNKLISAKEEIAHYNEYAAVRTMKGIAYSKYAKLFVRTNTNKDRFDDFLYDPKQLYQLLRIEDFISKYTSGENYASCLQSSKPDFLKAIKKGYCIYQEVDNLATKSLTHIVKMVESYTEDSEYNKINPKAEQALAEVQESIMKKSLAFELKE